MYIMTGWKFMLMFILAGMAYGISAQRSVLSEGAGETSVFLAGDPFPLLSRDPFDVHRVYGRGDASQKIPSALPVLNYLPGMFCKWEHAVEKKSGLAPRIRLGSLQYTEWMEGKKDLRFRYAR